MLAIAAYRLSKTFRYHQKAPGLRGSLTGLVRRRSLEREAVSDASFSVERGEIVGFLGPNGAGKTTTLKMLCGLLYPSAGRAEVLGYTPARRQHAFLRRIALVMGQKTMLNWDLPAMDSLLLQRDLYDVPSGEFNRTVGDLARMLDVAGLLRVQVRKLSLGERMKMELLAALIHRPEVLFLDEPTIGLDVVSQQRVREFLVQLNREAGTTILLTSHYMGDIEALCPRVLLIDRGSLRYDGSLDRLVQQVAPHKQITATLAEPLPAGVAPALAPWRQATDDPLTLRLSVPRDQVAMVTGDLLQQARVTDLDIEEAPVEEIVRQIFLHGGREAL